MKKFLKKQFSVNLNESIEYRKEVEAEERRKDNEWLMGPDCPEEGLRAHALHKFLISEGNVDEYTEQDRVKEKKLRDEIGRLNKLYDESEDTDTSILDKIEDLEDELDSMEKFDVYDIIPDGKYYDLSAFKVNKSSLDDRRYTVGDEDEMTESGRESVRNYIGEVGYDGFTKSFVNSHLDEDKIRDYAESMYNDDVYHNPEAWIDDSKRELSRKQEDEIRILERRIDRIEDQIVDLEDYQAEGHNVQSKIEDLRELIDGLKVEIEDIEESPNGDFPDEVMDDKVQELADDATSDPQYFLRDHGLEPEEFIDEEEFIDACLDADGPAHFLNHYDGSYDSIRIGEKYYEIMRIE